LYRKNFHLALDKRLAKRKGKKEGLKEGEFLFSFFVKVHKIVRPYVYLRMLARAKRQKLGNPRTEPHDGKELDDVDVLDDRERVFGGDGGAAGGNMAFSCGCGSRAKLKTSCTVGRLLLDFGSSVIKKSCKNHGDF